MKTLVDELQLHDPIAAFNGGLVVRPNLSVIREHLVPSEAAQAVIDILTRDTLDVWLYGDKDWYVTSGHGPHVDREEWTVKFPPTVVSTYEGLLDRVVKIVGVSDDHDVMAGAPPRCPSRRPHRRARGVRETRGDDSPARASSSAPTRFAPHPSPPTSPWDVQCLACSFRSQSGSFQKTIRFQGTSPRRQSVLDRRTPLLAGR